MSDDSIADIPNMFGGSEDTYENNQLESPIPDGLTPFGYWLHVMPIAPRRKSRGGIIMPDQRRDAEAFMNNIGRVVAIGDAAFKSSWWSDRKVQRLPKIGDLIRYSGARPRAFYFKGVGIVEIEDSMVRSFVQEGDFGEYRFWN